MDDHHLSNITKLKKNTLCRYGEHFFGNNLTAIVKKSSVQHLTSHFALCQMSPKSHGIQVVFLASAEVIPFFLLSLSLNISSVILLYFMLGQILT